MEFKWSWKVCSSHFFKQEFESSTYRRHQRFKLHFQFTIERSTVSEQGESIVLLDTSITVLKSGQVEVTVYRKATHSEKYLAFDSHHPGQSKAAVVKTLLDRAEAIPSNANKRKSEKENVLKDLKINGYTSHFIDNACEAKVFEGVSERLKRH